MKRTLTVLTAALFAAAIALPAFAQGEPAAAPSTGAGAMSSTTAPAEGGAAMSEAPAKKHHHKHHKKATRRWAAKPLLQLPRQQQLRNRTSESDHFGTRGDQRRAFLF